MKVLIIGGVAGGATAAARLRRLDEKAEIVILERSGYVSYANCGLPYFIGGEITERESLTLQTPESFFNRFRIDVRTRQEALHIHRAEKKVTVRDLNTGREYEAVSYTHLDVYKRQPYSSKPCSHQEPFDLRLFLSPARPCQQLHWVRETNTAQIA